jgi:hypothetical protein
MTSTMTIGQLWNQLADRREDLHSEEVKGGQSASVLSITGAVAP